MSKNKPRMGRPKIWLFTFGEKNRVLNLPDRIKTVGIPSGFILPEPRNILPSDPKKLLIFIFRRLSIMKLRMSPQLTFIAAMERGIGAGS